jgi:hypothetical protein
VATTKKDVPQFAGQEGGPCPASSLGSRQQQLEIGFDSCFVMLVLSLRIDWIELGIEDCCFHSKSGDRSVFLSGKLPSLNVSFEGNSCLVAIDPLLIRGVSLNPTGKLA